MATKSPLLLEIGKGLSLVIGLPRIVFWTTAERPKQAKRGVFGFNIQTKSLEYWDGASWFTASMTEE